MANTTNLDLVKPLGTDHALVSVINSNMDKIDAYAGNVNGSLNSLGDGLAIIANGDTHAAITSGQFVYVRGHNTLAEGLYVASADIAANGALSLSNLTADASGGLNSLNSRITPIEILASTDLNSLTAVGEYYCPNATRAAGLTHTPVTNDSFTLTVKKKGSYINQEVQAGTRMFLRRNTSGGFDDWEELALNSKLPITYTNSKYCSNTEGTLTLEVPAGKYLVQICGKTQTSDNFINMTLDDAGASNQSYLGALIGTNTSSKVITAQTTNIVTYNETHTMTVSYSANWYRVQVFATLIQ